MQSPPPFPPPIFLRPRRGAICLRFHHSLSGPRLHQTPMRWFFESCIFRPPSFPLSGRSGNANKVNFFPRGSKSPSGPFFPLVTSCSLCRPHWFFFVGTQFPFFLFRLAPPPCPPTSSFTQLPFRRFFPVCFYDFFITCKFFLPTGLLV